MSKNSNPDLWWSEIEPANYARINAEYSNGQLIDTSTKQPIQLNEGSHVRLFVGEFALPEQERKKHDVVERVLFLEKGSKLYFTLKSHDYGRLGEYRVEISDDLYIERKGNKSGRLSFVGCRVFEGNTDKQITQASSLNEAYTRTSVAVRPDARTHTANAFRVMFYEGGTLESLRPF